MVYIPILGIYPPTVAELRRTGVAQRLSTAQKVDIALAWLEPLISRDPAVSSIKPRSHETLATEFTEKVNFPVSPKAIAKAIREALGDGLISFVRQPIHRYRRRYDLEQQLVRKYKLRLRSAIVVESQDSSSSDDIHMMIGQALADEISARRSFRTGSRIGIGSGRGVFYTIDALRRSHNQETSRRVRELSPDRPIDETTILSLEGSLFPHSTMHGRDPLFDSDVTAATFAQVFNGLVHVRPVSYPLALSKEDKATVIDKTWLGQRNFDLMIPSHAIVGVGILDSLHRFHKAVRYSQEGPLELEPILEKLERLVATADNIMEQYNDYCPVADVCGRMFLVPPPDYVSERDRELLIGKVKEWIDDINDHLLTITKTQLSRIDSVMVLGGTKLKANAIGYLLSHPSLSLTADILSTDVSVGEHLLGTKVRR